MMKRRVFQRSIVLLIVLLIATIWATAAQAQTQATIPGEQGELDQLFKKARENFLRKDFKDAAADIRKEQAFVKQEAGRATGEAKQTLMASAQELNKLAEEL